LLYTVDNRTKLLLLLALPLTCNDLLVSKQRYFHTRQWNSSSFSVSLLYERMMKSIIIVTLDTMFEFHL